MKRVNTISLRFWLPILVLGAFVLLLIASSYWRSLQETQEHEQRAIVQLKFLITAKQYRLEQLLRLNTEGLIKEEIAQVGAIP